MWTPPRVCRASRDPSRVISDGPQNSSRPLRDDAESRAEWAETDAMLAIDYAYAAIEEAEYQTLDAILARREAEDRAVAAAR